MTQKTLCQQVSQCHVPSYLLLNHHFLISKKQVNSEKMEPFLQRSTTAWPDDHKFCGGCFNCFSILILDPSVKLLYHLLSKSILYNSVFKFVTLFRFRVFSFVAIFVSSGRFNGIREHGEICGKLWYSSTLWKTTCLIIDLFSIVTHFVISYHISLVKVQSNYCYNNLLILDVKQLNKIVKLYYFHALKNALWDGKGKIKMYYGMSRVKKQLSGKRSIKINLV